MSLISVVAVEVLCDGCGGRMEYGGGEYTMWMRDQVDAWVTGCDWRAEDGKHYCCTNAPNFDAAVCWPPSWRDEPQPLSEHPGSNITHQDPASCRTQEQDDRGSTETDGR